MTDFFIYLNFINLNSWGSVNDNMAMKFLDYVIAIMFHAKELYFIV